MLQNALEFQRVLQHFPVFLQIVKNSWKKDEKLLKNTLVFPARTYYNEGTYRLQPVQLVKKVLSDFSAELLSELQNQISELLFCNSAAAAGY